MKHYANVKSYARTPEIQELSSLIDIQLRSFEDFLYRGRLLELFDEINPIKSFNGNLSLYFPGNIPAAKEFDLRCEFDEPKYDEDTCLERDMSYAAPLYAYVALVNHEQADEVIRQRIFLGDFPLMTEKGTFIINGTERVVVSQLIRSAGVYFDAEAERATGRQLSNCKLIPDRGAWMEFETRKTDYITIKFNRKRTVPVTMLLRALAAVDDGRPPERSPIKTGDDDEILGLFADVDTDDVHPYIEKSLENEPDWEAVDRKHKKKLTIAEKAMIEFYHRMRPGDPETLDNAREYLEGQLFDQRRYDLERVGRYKLNQMRRDLAKNLEEQGLAEAVQRLGLKGEIGLEHRTMTKADIAALIAQMILINNDKGECNDIDHLGNRRVKTVGELVGNKLRIGLRRMERVVKERMSIREAEQLTPMALVNIRPIVSALREFFGSSQLSQLMEQTNPLSELTHKRTLSALGPGGLRRERARFDVRDVHHSHYGRICPIETPEGPNIGLIGRLASYARVNDLGFIETPYRKVVNTMPLQVSESVEEGRSENVFRKDTRTRKVAKSLIGYEVNEDVEVEVRGSYQADFDKLAAELSKGDGIISDLQKLRGEDVPLDAGKFKAHIAAVEAAIGRLSELHDFEQKAVSELREDATEHTKALKGLLGANSKEGVGQALKAATAFSSTISRVKKDGSRARVIVKKGAVIDAKILNALEEHGIQEIKVTAYKITKSLIGCEVNEDVEVEVRGSYQADFDTLAAELSKGDGIISDLQKLRGEDVPLDAGKFKAHIAAVEAAIGRLSEHPDVEQKAVSELREDATEHTKALNGLLGANSKEKADQALKAATNFGNKISGLKVKDGSRARVIVKKGAVIDAKILNALEEHGIQEIKVTAYKITKSLIGCEVNEDVEVEVRGSYQADFDTLAAELSKGDGIISDLQKLRREAVPLDAGKFKAHIAAVEAAIGRLSELPDFEQKAVSELREDATKHTKALKGLLGANSKEKADQALKAARNFGNTISRVKVKDGSRARVIVKKGAVIDAKILNALEEHGIQKIKVTAYKVNQNLIGRAVHSHVKGVNGKVIVERGVVIDDGILEKLKKCGIRKIEVTDCVIKEVDNPDLVGRTIRDDIEDDKENIIVEEGAVIDASIVKKLKKHGIKDVPVTPFATHDIEYLSADKEDRYTIAQANSRLDERSQFVSNRISARRDQGFLTARPHQIDYMDIAPRQIVGISAALIPFLSHDDANRALMGSNMQRQAVPLITPDVSVVSTGMEKQAASNSGQVLVSDIEAEVVSVQGHRVIVKTPEGDEVKYPLRKYDRSNQSTCIDQRPQVRKGDIIKPGDVIADSSSTYDGRLALGHDVLACFLSWDGGNYEDALLISEDMLRNDKFTSIHIEKHEIEARDTKLGSEEITYDIPNVGEEVLKDLDERGIVRIGAEVGPKDILVGKITPKGEKELSPEEKLLRAIFGEQAREVKDSSLRLPHGDRGKVVDVKIFTRDEHPDLSAGVEKMVRVSVAQRRKLTVGDKMAGRHGNKGVISKIVPIADMPYIEGGIPVEIILNPLGVPGRMNIGQILELHLGWAADRLGFRAITPVFDGAREHEIQAELGRAWMIDWAWKITTERAWENHERLAEMGQIALDEFDDDMHVICAYLVDRVGESGLYDNEAIILERDETYVRRVAAAEVLRGFGCDPDEVMVYDNADLPIEVRDRRDLNALRVSLQLWIQQNAAREIELEDSLEIRDLFEIADQVMFETGRPVPHYGKQTLYDGRTGEPFDNHVAVGYVHMLKLAHLVEDKAHARSTGPYSLVTQQPLGGKAQFGGQRFGEMEVWALEAYGAAYILQEMLTVKSDDVQGRVKTYESIVKGDPIEEPGIPTSFRVLVKELQSLGLAVEAITGSGDVIRFGKDDGQLRRPQPATGLLELGSRS